MNANESKLPQSAEEPIIAGLARLINITVVIYIICFGILLTPNSNSWCGNASHESLGHLFLIMPLSLILSWIMTILTPRKCPAFRLVCFMSILATCAWGTMIVLVFISRL